MKKGTGTKLCIKNMILSTFGKIALNFHGYSSFCFDILKKLFFKKSIFLGTEVEDVGGFCSFLKDFMFFFSYFIGMGILS